MRSRSLILLGLALVLMVAGLWWWQSRNQGDSHPNVSPTGSDLPAPRQLARPPEMFKQTVSESTAPAFLTGGSSSNATKLNPLAYRLANTPRTSGQLMRDDRAILLENALIDSSQPLGFKIPDHLKLKGEAGAYIVQARGVIDGAFRAAVTAAGAEFVSYVPNNAWLVRASQEAADRLTASGELQSVLPWEPVYKLKSELLPLAIEDKALPPDAKLNLLVYSDARSEVLAQLPALGATQIAEDRSPFGTIITVQPGEDWTALALLPGVQIVERAYARARANDLSRVRIGVATNSVTTTNHLGLTGTNVLVSLNDSGVDANHPDFELTRLFALNAVALTDTNGHGTHVAGILAGSGLASTNIVDARGSTNPGTNGQYRGVAPGAKLFVQAAAFELGVMADATLQENVARTNALISNNSWNYVGNSTYSLAAASYDAAVRDSLPGVPGSQPVLYVFSAGNGAGGLDNGLGGEAGSVLSPATAKNVLTVGAIELARDITNTFEVVNGSVTNKFTPWKAMTSSGNEVAAFSGRGNVGIEIEGDYGRAKPDVVAPGTFVISTRSTTWDERAYYNPTNHEFTRISGVVVQPNTLEHYPLGVPTNAVGFSIRLVRNEDSPLPLQLPIYLRRDALPTFTTFDLRRTNLISVPPDLALGTAVGQNWNYAVGNPTGEAVSLDIITELITINPTNQARFTALSNLNNSLSGTNGTGPHYYRYESGTSMAAPAASGTLALMQEFFEQRLRVTNSPALMKALLINGARAVSGDGNPYDFSVTNAPVYQGWGLIKLANSLPAGISNAFNWSESSPGPIKILDQSPTNALATGQSQTRTISLSEEGQIFPLRITLAWTDPPGNPAVGIKLVNDLDLVVTNLDTGDIFWGNDIPIGRTFNTSWDTNEPPVIDSVNNIENVYLTPDLGTNYAITVLARRVNVNAVTAHTNNVVQDYALVVSSGNGQVTNAITFVAQTAIAGTQPVDVIYVTNSVIQPDFVAASLKGQRAGANTPLLGTTDGITNQWKFYVVTNTTEFTNATFLVSQQTDLAPHRMGVFTPRPEEVTRRFADIDMYISLNSDLTNLVPAVVNGSFKSLTRNDLSGDELLIFEDSTQNRVYYVGVKSEDHMAAEYEFFAIFSLLPLGAEDANGFVRAYPMSGYAIPDGTAENPGGMRMVAITRPSISGVNESVRRIIVTNNVSHANYADVISSVDHNGRAAIFDNHRDLESPPYPVPPPGPYAFLYDDSGEGDFPNAIPPSGPGTFETFVGEAPGGTWYFTFSDDRESQEGTVTDVRIRVERQCENDCIITNTVAGNSWRYFSRNVPVEATNLTVCIQLISPLPGDELQLYIRRGARPTTNIYDFRRTITAAGGCLTIDKSTLPPLQSGRYFIGVFNPRPNAQTFTYQSIVGIGAPPTPTLFSGNTGSTPILDDAVTNYTQFVTNDAIIARLDVGLRIDHPRVSDLAATLISPRGTRVLLVENRGGTDTNGFGSSLVVSNFVPVNANGGAAAQTNFVDTGAPSGSITIDYEFFQAPDQMTVYYDGLQLTNTTLISGSGSFSLNYGPGATTEIEIVMNEAGNSDTNTLWTYTVSSINEIHEYLIFTDNTNRTTTPVKFALPPFVGTPGSTISIGDFEPPVLAQNYTAPTIGNPDGWSVLTNSVQVTNNPALAHSAPQFLALRQGTISRSLPLNLGRNYALTYAVRGDPSCFGYTNFNSTQGLSLAGHAAVVSNSFVRLAANQSGRNGALWAQNKMQCQDGFDTTFKFRISGPFQGGGGDGISFTIQNVGANATTFYSIGGGLGGTINVFFNTFRNWPGCTDPVNCDVSDNSVGIGINDQYVSQRDLTSLGIVLEDGNVHEARVIYSGGVMNVFLDGVLVLANVVLPGPGLSPGVDGCGFGWVGFASFSGASAANHDILDWSFCSAAPAPSGQIALSGVVTNTFTTTADWTLKSIVFQAGQTNTLLTVWPDNCDVGIYMDTFDLTESSGSRYVLPEESLKALEGENAYGEWKLEIIDTRTGASNNVSLVDWQLQFIFQPDTAVPPVLTPGVPRTNTVCAGKIDYYIVDVPTWSRFATNELLFATGPLNVYFNQNIRPTGTNTVPPDFTLLGLQTSGVVTLTTNNPAPPGLPVLQPGQRYYIGIENPSTNGCVTYAFLVDFDLVSFPPVVTLTNGVPYCRLNPGPAGATDYYLYTVSSNAVRAQFELYNLTGDMTLFLRRGLPPTFGVFDYISANVFTNDEVITVFDFTQPVELEPGDWYLGAANVFGPPVFYCVKATEWPIYGTNIVITNTFVASNSFCLTWTSLPGVRYYVEGLTDLASTNWAVVSPTIVATDYATTWCIALPSPFHFFRVREGMPLNTYVPPPIISSIRRTFRGIEITWGGPVTAQYQVQWSPTLVPAVWTTFPVPPAVTSTTGLFQFVDDGTQTVPPGLDGVRYYRLLLLP